MTICCRELRSKSCTFLICMLLGLSLIVTSSSAAKEDVVLATAIDGIRITQADLDRVIQDYQKRSL